MKFAVVGEGLTDFKVIKNLLMGFFKDKNLIVNRLLPKDKEPVGWGNVLKYLSTQEFQNSFDDPDLFVVVQIDTNECAEWIEGIKHIGDDAEQLNAFVEQIKIALIDKINVEFYDTNKNRIIFAICVHEIECWLLPFNAQQTTHYSKIVGCANTIEQIAKKSGFSIHQKNYQEGKHYDDFSKEMKNNKSLMQKSKLNPSLQQFIDTLIITFPIQEEE